MLQQEDFKHTVSLPTPHSIVNIRVWLYNNNIEYTYSTHDVGMVCPSVEYHFTKERDATLFILKWS